MFGGKTVVSWKERLPEILSGFSKEDIYNLDETGCFWRSLPDLRGEREKVQGREKSKLRITIAFLVNAVGDKEDPVVIWTSERPSCFRSVDIRTLPIQYYHQKKAWMIGDILNKVLINFNRKMSQQKRSVLLLMDNIGHHPSELKEKYSNVKILYQNYNIIATFKTHHHCFMLCFESTHVDNKGLE